MEKRIKLGNISKTPPDNEQKMESKENSWASKTKSSAKQVLKIAHKKDESMINAKRRLSALDEKRESKEEARKGIKKTNKVNFKTRTHTTKHSNKSSDGNEQNSLDVKKKKRSEIKFNEETSNFKSQIYQTEYHSEYTDEETQTSKAEENNNKIAAKSNNKETASHPIMDHSMFDNKGLSGSLSFEEKYFSQLQDKNKNIPLSESIHKSPDKSICRPGHYECGDQPLRIVKSEYNENINDVIFTMDWKTTEKYHDHPATSQVTREDLLKHDPLLLVYYYEKHLEFTQHPDYKAELELDRIPY